MRPPSPHTRFPLAGKSLHGERSPYLETLSISSRIPSEGAPPLQAPSMEPLQRETLHRAPFIHLSKFLVDEPSSRFPKWSLMERDAHLQSLFYISFRVPSKGALPPGSLHRTFTERERHTHSTSRAPFNHVSKFLVDVPTPGCPSEPP